MKKLTAKYKPIRGWKGGEFIKYKRYSQETLYDWLRQAEENSRINGKIEDYTEEANLLTRITKKTPKALTFQQIREYTLDCANCEYRKGYEKSLVTEPCKTCYDIFSKTNSKTNLWKFDKNAVN